MVKLFTAFVLAVLILTNLPGTIYGEAEPANGVVTQTHTFLCNDAYLFEVNTSFRALWIVGYRNTVNVSIRAIDPVPSTRVTATLSVDGLTVSEFLGRLESHAVLSSSLGVVLTPPLFQVPSGAREVKQARLTLLLIEPKCTFAVPILFILSASDASLEASVWVEPNTVEVNTNATIFIEVKNPTYEVFTGVEVYVYVNKSLVRSLRMDSLESSKSLNLRMDYTPLRVGTYIVEVKIAYTAPHTVYKETNAAAVFVAKNRSSLLISSNATLTHVGRAVLFSGRIEPRTGGRKMVKLEVSRDDRNWSEVARLEVIDGFNYSWIPTQPGVYYIKARLLESQLLYATQSNVLMVVVEKIRPSVSIRVDWPYVEVGSKALVKVDVSPPIINAIEILYRLSNESTWSRATGKVNRETSIVELSLPRPGIYEVKVLVPESEGVYRVESNTIQLYVRSPKTETVATGTTLAVQQIPYRSNVTVALLIAVSTAVALLILVMKRR